ANPKNAPHGHARKRRHVDDITRPGGFPSRSQTSPGAYSIQLPSSTSPLHGSIIASMSAATPAPSLERGTSDTARVGLTVVIPTLNEEAQIAVAVRDLAWVDDVIVIDGGSIDQTVMLAQHAGARVLLAPGVTIAGQRNVGIAAARHE